MPAERNNLPYLVDCPAQAHVKHSMKRYWVWSLALGVIFLCAGPAWATNPGNKLARGVINIPTSIIEIKNAYCSSKEKLSDYSKRHPEDFLTPALNTPYQYLLKAPLTGIAKMACRVAVGCYDIVTFPFALPRYYAPVYEPEFAFDSVPYVFKIYEQGVVCMNRGAYRCAIEKFSQVIKLDPGNAGHFITGQGVWPD